MIYNVQQIGPNQLLINESIPSKQFMLAVFYLPCNNTSTDVNGDKKAVFDIFYCNGFLEVNFEGVESFYEDLLSGLVYYPVQGTWRVNLYYQDNDFNQDVSMATFITQIQLQVVGN